MASLGDEIDNCGLFLEQRRRHILCSGELSTQQPEHARILPAKVQLLNFLDSQAKSAHQSINLEQVLDAAVQYVFPTGLVKSTTGYKAQKLSLQGIEASSTCSMQIFLPWAVSKPFTGAILSIREVEYDIEREIKALGQSGLPRADWIAKTLLAAAPQMP
jgi:hypothetical protein